MRASSTRTGVEAKQGRTAARRVEHADAVDRLRVQDVVGWRAIFDQGPVGRAQHGVTRHWLDQDCEDPNHLMLSLEFPSAEQAKVFSKALEPVWEGRVSGRPGCLSRLRRGRTDDGPEHRRKQVRIATETAGVGVSGTPAEER